MPFGWGSRSKTVSKSEDKLTTDDVPCTCQLQCDSGIPYTADSCAYEPIQKLLAVRGILLSRQQIAYGRHGPIIAALAALQIATSDGRVKLLGKQGVEKTLYSVSQVPYGTRQLDFVDNRAILYRVSEVSI